MRARTRLLEELIEATGEPPDYNEEPEEVLRRAQTMVERRSDLIEALANLGPVTNVDEIEPLWSDLRDRERRWDAVIQHARGAVRRRLAPRRPRRRTRRGPVVLRQVI